MAERLTKRFDSGNVGFFKDGTPTENAMKLPKIMELLAAYEDTGLEPSEVVDTVKLLQDVATKYETSVKINSINTGLLNKAQEELEAYRALGTVEEFAELVEAKQDGAAKTAYDENSVLYLVEAEGTEAKHIIELLTAEANNRCVVLPCKKEHYLPEEWFYIMQNCIWSVKAVDAMRPVFKHGIRKFYSTPEEAKAALAKEDNDDCQ